MELYTPLFYLQEKIAKATAEIEAAKRSEEVFEKERGGFIVYFSLQYTSIIHFSS